MNALDTSLTRVLRHVCHVAYKVDTIHFPIYYEKIWKHTASSIATRLKNYEQYAE